MNEKITEKKKVLTSIAAIALFAVALLFDQFTKYLAVVHLKGKEPFILIDGVFQFSYLENTGAAFGLLEGKQMVFIVGAVVICIVFLFLFLKMPFSPRYVPLRICGVFLCAGAVGNLIDRIRLQYVVDFLYFNLIDFPVFNVADCYVVVACFVFVFLFLFYYRDEDFSFAAFGEKKNV